MFCPSCKYEYLPEVKICADCNEELVTEEELEKIEEENKKVDFSMLLDELNELGIESEIEWVHIARLNSHEMSEMLLEVLHSKSIASVVHSETGYFGISGQIGMSSYSPIGGGYSLFVDADKIEDVDNEAKILLGDEWEKCKLIHLN